MRLVATWEEVEPNLMELERLSASSDCEEIEAYRALIAKGICFLVYLRHPRLFFPPSRFIGYVANNFSQHNMSEDKDGRETNSAISHILGHQPQPHAGLDGEYRSFCARVGVRPPETGSFGSERKYWIKLS